MKAMILSAGRGNRMRPLTDKTPKPLLKVKDKALIEWHIEKLAKSGFKEIIINIAHLGYQIPEYLGDGSKWNIKILYSDEQEEGALESAGGIIKALPLLGKEPFLVVNGDVWSDYNFNSSFKLTSLAHLILVQNPEHNLKGDFNLDNGFVSNSPKYTFSGIGYYSYKLFEKYPYGVRGLASILKEKMSNQEITGELFNGVWMDIGTPKRLEDLNKSLIH